ncbi:hypothetical protein PUN28_002925 [Cardiocondyla obscurior]|uniref:Uncharacterized protein n=1 Tax=Cardiocondyla obscurior TaxID=286306 RepID=A0AAW2GWM6_9HYME
MPAVGWVLRARLRNRGRRRDYAARNNALSNYYSRKMRKGLFHGVLYLINYLRDRYRGPANSLCNCRVIWRTVAGPKNSRNTIPLVTRSPYWDCNKKKKKKKRKKKSKEERICVILKALPTRKYEKSSIKLHFLQVVYFLSAVYTADASAAVHLAINNLCSFRTPRADPADCLKSFDFYYPRSRARRNCYDHCRRRRLLGARLPRKRLDSYDIVISRTLLGIMFSINRSQRENLRVARERIRFVIKLSFRAESIFPVRARRVGGWLASGCSERTERGRERETERTV